MPADADAAEVIRQLRLARLRVDARLRAYRERLRAELDDLYADSEAREASGEVWEEYTGPGT